MESKNEKVKENDTKDTSSGNTSCGKEKSPDSRTFRPSWNVTSVRGKVTDKCLWSACKAMTAGFLFIVVGAGMATLGFYSDHLSTVEETKGNTTVWVKNESKDSHLGSLTYLGPVVMGIGGFTIVAACVMTFEARDTAAKIVPVWFRRTRIHVVSGASGSTPSGRSSKTSWERFLNQQRSSEDPNDSRTAITQALVNFSKYLQNSVDTNKLPQYKLSGQNRHISGLRKCPSEPNVAKLARDANGNNLIETMGLLEASTPQPSQRTCHGKGLKPMIRTTKPQLLSVAPDTYRQAVSMDCPQMNRHPEDCKENDPSNEVVNPELTFVDRSRAQGLTFQTSCATSSSGSMSVDIYLPQGAVTLKIHDDMKENKKSHLTLDDSDGQTIKISQQSDILSFGDEDDLLAAELDDSVFICQDTSDKNSEVVLTISESAIPNTTGIFGANNLLEPTKDITENVGAWMKQVDSSSSQKNISTQFSLESERDSTGASTASVISSPFSQAIYNRQSTSGTDTTFFNVSSLGSMDSSHSVNSPFAFYENPQNPLEKEQRYQPLAECAQKHILISLDSQLPSRSENECKPSARKFSSLESAELTTLKHQRQTSESPNKPTFSFETSDIKAFQDKLPVTTPKYLSPGPTSPTVQPSSVLTFSPRKSRSESLPERRQAPSLKRFPLLRQTALDAFAEESGSTHRLDRSHTQISPKTPHSPKL